MKVNISGITNEEELLQTIKLGCDNIGLKVGQLNRAKDFILLSTAQRLALKSLAFCPTFIITEYSDINEVLDLAKNSQSKTIELHGIFSLQEIALLRKNIATDVKLVFYIKLNDKLDIEFLKEFYPYIDAVTLDISHDDLSLLDLNEERSLEFIQAFIQASLIPVIIKGLNTPITLEATLNIIKPFAVSLDYDKLITEFTVDKQIDYKEIYNFIKNLKNFPSTIPEKFYFNSQR
ncbi:hypothetical protein AAEX28_12675 [Lentisphaerota bacterium WC36G]|nr:hypothetical protein LJT99_15495 [Lentisphaerae bacterium WC36]